MRFKKLGKTNEKIPALGMGTWNIKDTASQIAAIKSGLKLGMRFIDTAELYGTEPVVAKAVKGEDDVFIATKVTPHHFGYNSVIEACDASLKRLGIKQIDLYQLHWPNPLISIKETMRAMEFLVGQGKIRHIGISNFSVRRTIEAQNALKKNEIVSNQVKYSPFDRNIEKEILPFCEKEKITVIAYSPFETGSFFERNAEIMQVIEDIAKRYRKTAAQVTLNWMCSRKPVMAIPKASSVSHMKENAAALDFTLKREDVERIDAASSGFPHPSWRYLLQR